MRHIEAKLHRRGNFVDVLPARPDASTKLSESSFSSMAMASVTAMRGISIGQTQHFFGALEGQLLCVRTAL